MALLKITEMHADRTENGLAAADDKFAPDLLPDGQCSLRVAPGPFERSRKATGPGQRDQHAVKKERVPQLLARGQCFLQHLTCSRRVRTAGGTQQSLLV